MALTTLGEILVYSDQQLPNVYLMHNTFVDIGMFSLIAVIINNTLQRRLRLLAHLRNFVVWWYLTFLRARDYLMDDFRSLALQDIAI